MSHDPRSPRRVAVACQGGGSHTAFTAGALETLLRGQAGAGDGDDHDDGVARPHWDGLPSQNPPLRNLVTDPDVADTPDEVWLLRVNPEARERTPTSLAGIADRRNELVGNLSVRQELHFLAQVNAWSASGALDVDYAPTTVRELSLTGAIDDAATLTAASKLDRDPAFLARLRDAGRRAADRFLANPDADDYRVAVANPGS